MRIRFERPTPMVLAASAVLALLVFGSAYLGIWMTRFDGRVASLWLGNAIVLAMILRTPLPQWPLPLAAAVLANIVASAANGDSLSQASALATCNLIEMVVVGVPMARQFGTVESLGEIRLFERFLWLAGLAGPAASGLAASVYLAAAVGAPVLPTFVHWFLADSLGLLTLAPLLMAIPRWPWAMPSRNTLFEPVALVVLVAGASALALSQDLPLLFAILPLLLLTAVRASPPVAALALVIVAAEATAFTMLGKGPIQAAHLSGPAETMLLQSFVAAALLVTLPFNIVMRERNRLHRALLESERVKRAEAEALAEARSRFLATMSHEIRTPLTGVLGMIDLLGDEISVEDRALYMGTLRQSASLLMSVLDDVLDFSKVDSGAYQPDLVDLDFEAAGQATVDLFFNAASRKGVLLTFICQAGDSAIVRGDRIRLQQVMGNLIGNAIKFTDRGSIKASLTAGSPEGGRRRWRFAVCDSGIGISPADRALLFEPFLQSAEAGARRPGTGLGLAISKRLVEAMGGSIGVDSKPGKGATFWFEIDLEDGDAHRVVPTHLAIDRAAAHPLSVLVAEDNSVNQLLVKAMLERMGHRVTVVADGREAVEAAEREPFDCILMDMQMPVLDGIAATRAIRSGGGLNAASPIFALTADASRERRRFYENAGLTDFLTKPINVELLTARLNALPHSGSAPAPPDAFDRKHLATLRAALGPRRLGELLDLFAGELERRPEAIRGALDSGALTAARREGHSLKGAAASIGAAAVSEIALKIEKAEDETQARAAVALLDGAVKDALAAIDRLRPQPLGRAC